MKKIGRSLGFDRKTVRKYVRIAKMVGVSRGEPFPDESELVKKLKGVADSGLLRETPASDLLVPYRDWMAKLLKDEEGEWGQVLPFDFFLIRDRRNWILTYLPVIEIINIILNHA